MKLFPDPIMHPEPKHNHNILVYKDNSRRFKSLKQSIFKQSAVCWKSRRHTPDLWPRSFLWFVMVHSWRNFQLLYKPNILNYPPYMAVFLSGYFWYRCYSEWSRDPPHLDEKSFDFSEHLNIKDNIWGNNLFNDTWSQWVNIECIRTPFCKRSIQTNLTFLAYFTTLLNNTIHVCIKYLFHHNITFNALKQLTLLPFLNSFIYKFWHKNRQL